MAINWFGRMYYGYSNKPDKPFKRSFWMAFRCWFMWDVWHKLLGTMYRPDGKGGWIKFNRFTR